MSEAIELGGILIVPLSALGLSLAALTTLAAFYAAWVMFGRDEKDGPLTLGQRWILVGCVLWMLFLVTRQTLLSCPA